MLIGKNIARTGSQSLQHGTQSVTIHQCCLFFPKEPE